MISFKEQSDYRIGRNVSFLLSSKEGWENTKYVCVSDFTVSWCPSCDILHCIDLQIQLIDKGISVGGNPTNCPKIEAKIVHDNKNPDYLYLKPNISNIKDKRQGIDYFVEDDHVKKYASSNTVGQIRLITILTNNFTNDSVSSSLTDNDETNNNLAIKSPKKEPTNNKSYTK